MDCLLSTTGYGTQFFSSNIPANAYHSISFLPKIGSVTDWDMTRLDKEIEKVLLDAVKEP
jgi:hypothetical protein